MSPEQNISATGAFSCPGAVNATQINAGTVPASASVLGSNSSSQPVAATAGDISTPGYIAGGGTAQAQTVTLVPAVTSLVNGLEINFKPNAANTAAAPTLAVNGLTAKPITKQGTSALVANDLITAAIAKVIYDGTEFQLQNPQSGAGGTVTSVSGDGTLISNSGSTGGVALTLGTAAANTFFGRAAGTTGAPGYSTLGASAVSPPSYIAAAGSVNVLTATLSPAATALTVGLEVKFLPNLANTSTTPTLNVNALGAATITKFGTAALVAGDLSTTAVADVIYDGTRWQLQNPQTNNAIGTVTSIATTGPITGGTISSSGTIACATCTVTVASGTIALGTTLITSGSCGTAATATATGAATTDVAAWSPNADWSAITGYSAVTTGGLVLYVWVSSSNTISAKQCNPTASSITPGAATINYRVTR